MDFCRRSARKGKIRNNIIKHKINVTKSLLDDIKTKQLQWYGHVQRMEEGRLLKQVIKLRPPGRRKRGKPKLTWAEGIKGLMGEKGLMEKTGMTEATGGRIYCNCQMGAERCENIVQPAK
jgi:hypothetical protein